MKCEKMAIQVSRLQSFKPFNGFFRSISTTALCREQASPDKTEWAKAKPFDQIPTPKKWTIIGTAWQFLPVVGN
jgi:hypothetical protein